MKDAKPIFLLVSVAILVAAAWLRFDRLALKPFHHDESVNYGFMSTFVDEGSYRYNPTNYHGPLLYELAYLPSRLIGMDEVPLRAAPALFGTLCVLTILAMRRFLGTAGTLFSAAALALSAADVYFSRTFIHEIYLAFSLAAFAFFFLRWLADMKFSDLTGAFISIVLAFSFKETAALAAVSIVIAFVFAHSFQRESEGELSFDWPWRRAGWDAKNLRNAAFIALVLWALFFSTFGTNPRGLLDFFSAFLPWAKTGTGKTGHEKSFTYFFIMLYEYYWPLLIALVPGIVSLIRKRRPIEIFFFAWFIVQLAFYSAIPYKTPWCVVTIAVPMFFFAAMGISDLFELIGRGIGIMSPRHLATDAGIMLGLMLIPYSWFSYVVNFERYDDDDYKIVYVQTKREYLDMVAALDRAAARAEGFRTEILSIDAKNPTQFYLRKYPNRTVEAEAPEYTIKAPLILVNGSLVEKIRPQLAAEYVESSYPIWPGQTIGLLVRPDLADKKDFPEGNG